MPLYFGSEKRMVTLNGVTYNFESLIKAISQNGVKLLSSDKFILKDLNGLYLAAKESK